MVPALHTDPRCGADWVKEEISEQREEEQEREGVPGACTSLKPQLIPSAANSSCDLSYFALDSCHLCQRHPHAEGWDRTEGSWTLEAERSDLHAPDSESPKTSA